MHIFSKELALWYQRIIPLHGMVWLRHVHFTAELLSKLSGERNRWQHQLASFANGLQQLPKDALMTAAFITYLSGQPEDVRAAVVRDWSR